MKVWFDEQPVNWGPDWQGRPTEDKTVVFFHLEKPSTADKKAEPFLFDGPATEAHKKQYADAWKAFEDSKKKESVPVDEVAPKTEVGFSE